MTACAQTPIPLNDLKRPSIGSDRVMQAAIETLKSGWWLNGARNKTFCEAFRTYVGASHCLGVANGSDALEIALRAILDVRRPAGRDVITVANAGGYSSIACRLVGLVPVYVDIELQTQLASIPAIVDAVDDDTAAIIVTHLYGGACNVPVLREELSKRGRGDIAILEDCAQAHGARLPDGSMVGSLGDIATFSFYPTKNLGAFGDGGAIVAQDEELFAHCQRLYQYGWSSKYTISVPYGRNSRLDEVQAAILSELLPGLDAANRRRIDILDRYTEALPTGITLVRSPNGSVGHLAVILCDDRDAFRAHMEASAVQTEIHYPILDCDQPGWQELPCRIAAGGIAVSRSSVKRIVTLPCFPGMIDEEIDRVCHALRTFQ